MKEQQESKPKKPNILVRLIALLVTAALLLGALLLGAAATLACSRLLSATVLKGAPSSFTLELPPFRRPRVGQVVVRSLLDRTVFVLGRALAVAAPAGLAIWLLAALPLRRAKLASCVSSCVLSMALDSADSPTADCGRTIRREISRTLASSRARASACA